MKTREELIKHCCYPELPIQTCSLRRFYSHISDSQNWLWVGGKLTQLLDSGEGFVLSAQSIQIKCFLSPNCHLSFKFENKKNSQSTQKIFKWNKISSLLREGDSVVIGLKNTHVVDNKEIHKIEQIVLVSVCTTKVLKSPSTEKYQRQWFDFLKWTREAMELINLFPVKTPSLLNAVGSEPDLNIFETTLYSKTGSRKMFLPTSPEIYMKRLLCRGWTDIYEIKKCFRNMEFGSLNSCEFYLLEWYRAYSPLNVLIEDLSYLFQFLSRKFEYKEFAPFKTISMKELFKEYLTMDLNPDSSKQDFINQLKKMLIPFDASQSLDDLFYLLFLNGIEPFIDGNTPLIIYNYPPFQKAYAQINKEGWASRFELFWRGMELANAFNEVVNPKEQEKRFHEEHQKRKQKLPIPSELLEDMQGGMPVSSGVALGLDRLFMIFTQTTSIQKAQCFL